MYKNRGIGVVIPVYNEELLVKKVLDTMPDFVDLVIVVDDKSEDASCNIVERYISSSKREIILIKHAKNEGVGGAIVTGYKRAIEENIDIAVVMAGDAQMDPDELYSLLDALIVNNADYVKGNRLFNRQAWQKMPKYRYLGNAFLSLFTDRKSVV